jgi:hypothetical protein
MKDTTHLQFTAYQTGHAHGAKIVQAPIEREWMNATHNKFANRCLPVLLANQYGWFILSGQKIDLWWTGLTRTSDLRIRLIEGDGLCMAESHFGYGILTWKIPFLFETPAGYNLLARGPANYPKDGICPLEGIIEADWASATFTMNWKVTRRFKRITFEVGEPICFLVPHRRRELEQFRPAIRNLCENPTLEEKHKAWSDSRARFNADLKLRKNGPTWQRHYFVGEHVGTEHQFPDHQRKINLLPFSDSDS